MCTEEFSDPDSLNSLLARCLITLDKCSDLRPIRAVEVLRHMLGKMVAPMINWRKLNAGCGQLCAAQVYVKLTYMQYLLFLVSLKIHPLNRPVLIHNIKIIRPEISNYLYSNYYLSAGYFYLAERKRNVWGVQHKVTVCEQFQTTITCENILMIKLIKYKSSLQWLQIQWFGKWIVPPKYGGIEIANKREMMFRFAILIQSYGRKVQKMALSNLFLFLKNSGR